MDVVERAIAIRDKVLSWPSVGGTGYIGNCIQGHGWVASYWNMADLPIFDEGGEFHNIVSMAQNEEIRLPSGLDLWDVQEEKLLSMRWTGPEIEVLLMKRGRWEQALFALPIRKVRPGEIATGKSGHVPVARLISGGRYDVGTLH